MDVKDIKKVVVAGGGVLGSQIAFQSAYMGYDVTIWLRSEGSIGRCQPKIDRLHTIYLDTLEAMKTDPRAYAYGLVAKEECTPEKCEALKANVEAAYKNLKLVTDWDEAFELTVAFAASIRMVPLKVQKEVPGYLLNSMLVPFLSAAEALWAGGVGSVEDIDRAWTLSTGAPAGPFRILDIVGLQTAYNIVIMDPRVKDPTTIQSAIAAGLKEKIDKGETGINAGIGFYDYRK